MLMYRDPVEHARRKKATREKGKAREIWMRNRFPFLYKGFKPSWIEISRNQLTLPRLPAAFHGYKIAHISDIHYGTWMTQERLAGVVELVNQERPDLVVITGDFVSYDSAGSVKALSNELSKLTAPDGIKAIFGNHDHWAGTDPLMLMLEDIEIANLNNAVIAIHRNEDLINLAGVDDLWEGLSDIESITPLLNPDDCNILLAHEPDFCLKASSTRLFDLQLSGHSHGGQMRLPYIGPVLRIPGAIQYPEGLYQIGCMQLYTNRGLGTSTVPIRINCKPEIAIHKLISDKKS